MPSSRHRPTPLQLDINTALSYAMNEPYVGQEKLVISLDIGTTQTAACLIHLQPGAVPTLRTVTKWPGDATSSKIPTQMLFADGVAKAFGAECLEEYMRERAAEEDWQEAKWFKLRLHPASMAPPAYTEDDPVPGSTARAVPIVSDGIFEVPPLPLGVTVQQAYEHWFKFVLEATKQYFFDTSADAEMIWSRLSGSIVFVVAHPNGWGLYEQEVLRRAMTGAGFFSMVSTRPASSTYYTPAASVAKPDDPANDPERLVFVTEAEASVHFGLHHSPSNTNWLTVGKKFAVVDAGGSTIDTCVYEVVETSPKLKIKEFKTSDCIQAGGIFPTRFFRRLLEKKLEGAGSKYNKPEYVDSIVETFDVKTKTKHSGSDENHVIKFGYERDTDRAAGISKGRITLSSAELEGTNATHLLLVGGFGESPYVIRRLRERYEPALRIITADEPARKAVSEGAALFFLQSTVVARAVKMDAGIQTTKRWDEYKVVAGSRPTYTSVDGQKRVEGGWTRIVKKGTVMDSDKVIKESFNHVFKSKADMSYSITLRTCDHDSMTHGGWMTTSTGVDLPGFSKCCTLSADLSPLATAHNQKRNNLTGETYWHLNFRVGIYFGGTSLRACILWDENGVERQGPASVIPANFYN